MTEYHNYLLTRSLTGYIYRRFYLYPLLLRYLFGDILDVGCGIGDFVSFSSSTGLDVDDSNIAYSHRRGLSSHYNNYPFLHASSSRAPPPLPFPNQTKTPPPRAYQISPVHHTSKLRSSTSSLCFLMHLW